MFKKKTVKKKVIISNEIEKELYINYMISKGLNVRVLYVVTEYPVMASVVMIEESDKAHVQVSRKVCPIEGTPFHKVIKKSFVYSLIAEKNERVENQKRMKAFLKDLPNTKGYELMQSAVDKNAYKIQTLHFAINLLFGKVEKPIYGTYQVMAIKKFARKLARDISK